jgi:hypothetical protein
MNALPDLPSIFRERVAPFFPNATPAEAPVADLEAPSSFFLREDGNLLWIEMAVTVFGRNELPVYLEKLQKIQAAFPSSFWAVLAAPGFETGVEDILELVRVPVRIFRYREKEEKVTILPPTAAPPTSWQRLTREELREFIQLDLDLASRQYKA